MIKKACPLLFAWLFSYLVAFPLSSVADSSTIIQSPNDPKAYRALTLENGLQVVLVSDPAADKSAASLDVYVGNGSDPDEWQGLAHFLEHMLFLGNEKYPEADEYRSFMDTHGGSNNAYTSFDHTNYYFDISAEYLQPALDRFAWFFIAPTFDEAFVQRERAVVHSEYQSRLNDENRRVWSARRQLINPEHPASRFAIGSTHTLRDRTDGSGSTTVRQQLVEFYAKYYSANIMTLAVVGKESLDQLEEWVTQSFSAIPSHNARLQLFMQPYINPELISSRLHLTPQKDQLSVTFMFPITSAKPYYQTKPLSYIGNLIGHEGEGSLFALLDQLGWAETLGAGAGYMDDIHGTFEVSIQLTEEGLQRINEIGELLFQYIALVKTQGVEEWRYEEERNISRIAFRFTQEQAAGTFVRSLAARMHRYPIEDLLQGPYMMEKYQPDLITTLLDQLNPDNVLIQVVSKNRPADSPKPTGKKRTTPFFDVEYDIQPIAEQVIRRWKRGETTTQLATSLHLPVSNPFIAERLKVKSNQSPLSLLTSLFSSASRAAPIPERLDIKGPIDAWYCNDQQFGTPRATFYFNVQTSFANQDARSRVLTELWIRMINQQLNPTTYPARLAHLDYQLYRHSRGFSVRISGYEDKQSVLLETLLTNLLSPSFDADKLALHKAEVAREWKNVFLNSPSSQTVHEMYRLLLHPYWSESERLAALEGITLSDLYTHANRLLETIHITTLAHGDISRARAINMNQILELAFKDSDLDSGHEVTPLTVKVLPDNRNYLRSLDVEHDDSAVAIYFQGREKSDEERAKMALLTQLIKGPFFFNLRTTNQVGYLVHATSLNVLEVPGLLFSIQSPTHTPIQINKLIDLFLEEFEETLTQMPADELMQAKQGLRTRIMTRDKRLANRTNRYWQEIDLRKFDFDSRERLSALIENLDKKAILGYFQQLTEQQPRKLIVQSTGRREQAVGGQLRGATYRATQDVIKFRKTAHDFFPVY